VILYEDELMEILQYLTTDLEYELSIIPTTKESRLLPEYHLF
jgi:hypothetical protein